MTNPSGDVPRTSGRHGRGIGWGVAAAVAVLLLVAAPAAAGAPSSGAERSRDTTAEGGALPAAAAAAFLQDDDAVIVAAIEVSEQRFPDGEPGPGVPTAGWAVLSRTGVFADSLTGSALTVSGPLLFTPSDSLDPRTLAELERVLDDGDRIYLLGGEAALSAGIEETLQDAGFATVRLAGPSRVETAAAIAERMLDIGGSGRVLIARADGPADNPTAAWADSVTAGAWAADQAVPILLTQTDSLHPAVHTHLDRYRPETVVLLGGEAALSAAVAAEIPGVQRIAGPNRFATAVAVADELWTASSGEYLVTSGTAVDGWAYGLAAAGLGGQTDRPLLLVETDRLPAEIDAALCATGTRAPVTVIGGLDVVSQQVRDAMTAPCGDTSPPGPPGADPPGTRTPPRPRSWGASARPRTCQVVPRPRSGGHGSSARGRAARSASTCPFYALVPHPMVAEPTRGARRRSHPAPRPSSAREEVSPLQFPFR